MAALQTLCSNTVDLSLSTAQNIWTTRTLSLTNAVIIGAVVRDTVGLALANAAILQIDVAGNSTYSLVYVVDSTSSGPRFAVGLNILHGQSFSLTTNPTVTATVISGATATSMTVTVDIIGYFI